MSKENDDSLRFWRNLLLAIATVFASATTLIISVLEQSFFALFVAITLAISSILLFLSISPKE